MEKVFIPKKMFQHLIKGVLIHDEFSQAEKLKTIDFLINVSEQEIENKEDCFEDSDDDDEPDIKVSYDDYIEILKLLVKIFSSQFFDFDW